MFVYRAERFNEEGYFLQMREEYLKYIEDEIEKFSKKIEIKENERNKYIRKEEYRNKSFLYIRNVNEFSDEQKNELIQDYLDHIYRNKKRRVDPKKKFNGKELLKIQKILYDAYLFPASQLNDEITFLKNRQLSYKRNESKKVIIALNSNFISKEIMDKVKRVIDELTDEGIKIYFAIDDSMVKRSNDSEVNYVYTRKEIELLVDIDAYLRAKGHSELLINENNLVTSYNEYIQGWSLGKVIIANKKIDEIVNYIKKNNLSPFEAMLYIHKWASSFEYKEGDKTEISRILPSVLNSSNIVCSGYASLVKAVVDKLNISNLKCEMVGGFLIKGSFTSAHCHNIVHIKDDKYDINGSYIEDACWDSKNKEYEQGRGFAHCLYPVNDLYHFSNRVAYYNETVTNRYENIMVNARISSESLKYKDENIITQMILRQRQLDKLRNNSELVRMYGDVSTPIELIKYEQALRVVYSRMYKDNSYIEELVKKDIENSRVNSVRTFAKDATNLFVASISEKERRKIRGKTGPSAIQ